MIIRDLYVKVENLLARFTGEVKSRSLPLYTWSMVISTLPCLQSSMYYVSYPVGTTIIQ